MSVEWKEGRFLVGLGDGVREVTGWCTADLGLELAIEGSPKGRRKPLWSLVHLNTGHRIFCIQAEEHNALALASQVHELTDWSFVSLDGWRDRDPRLHDKVIAVADEAEFKVEFLSAGRSQEAARQIAMARA